MKENLINLVKSLRFWLGLAVVFASWLAVVVYGNDYIAPATMITVSIILALFLKTSFRQMLEQYFPEVDLELMIEDVVNVVGEEVEKQLEAKLAEAGIEYDVNNIMEGLEDQVAEAILSLFEEQPE